MGEEGLELELMVVVAIRWNGSSSSEPDRWMVGREMVSVM